MSGFHSVQIIFQKTKNVINTYKNTLTYKRLTFRHLNSNELLIKNLENIHIKATIAPFYPIQTNISQIASISHHI